mmetsp:Transcript_3690/g.8787  ORF Transcript_3690/g.8787 Transcript_3690/m.8787 type:complete len:314 (-) Transcript_3690:43-984(-)
MLFSCKPSRPSFTLADHCRAHIVSSFPVIPRFRSPDRRHQDEKSERCLRTISFPCHWRTARQPSTISGDIPRMLVLPRHTAATAPSAAPFHPSSPGGFPGTIAPEATRDATSEPHSRWKASIAVRHASHPAVPGTRAGFANFARTHSRIPLAVAAPSNGLASCPCWSQRRAGRVVTPNRNFRSAADSLSSLSRSRNARSTVFPPTPSTPSSCSAAHLKLEPVWRHLPHHGVVNITRTCPCASTAASNEVASTIPTASASAAGAANSTPASAKRRRPPPLFCIPVDLSRFWRIILLRSGDRGSVGWVWPPNSSA